MKKHTFAILATILVFISIDTKAQIKKGEKMLGASVSFISSKLKYDNSDEDSKITQVMISPQLGFGLGKNWVAGFGIGYTYEKQDYEGTLNDADASLFSGGLFLRKFYELNEKFGVYGQLDFSVGIGEGDRDGITPFDVDVTTISGIVHPGFYFRPANKLVIEAMFGRIGYTSTKREYSGFFNDSKESNFEFSVTDGFSLGFKIIF
jgi:hypothetical protein